MLARGVPTGVSTDRIRPCTSEETLAYQYINAAGNGHRYEAGLPQEQQTFLAVPTLDDIERGALSPDIVRRHRRRETSPSVSMEALDPARMSRKPLDTDVSSSPKKSLRTKRSCDHSVASQTRTQDPQPRGE